VLEGRLRYILEAPLAREEILEPGRNGVVVSEVAHRVVPEGRCASSSSSIAAGERLARRDGAASLPLVLRARVS
jgi:hypothetical protein